MRKATPSSTSAAETPARLPSNSSRRPATCSRVNQAHSHQRTGPLHAVQADQREQEVGAGHHSREPATIEDTTGPCSAGNQMASEVEVTPACLRMVAL